MHWRPPMSNKKTALHYDCLIKLSILVPVSICFSSHYYQAGVNLHQRDWPLSWIFCELIIRYDITDIYSQHPAIAVRTNYPEPLLAAFVMMVIEVGMWITLTECPINIQSHATEWLSFLTVTLPKWRLEMPPEELIFFYLTYITRSFPQTTVFHLQLRKGGYC